MRSENFRVRSFGSTHIDPRYLCVGIDVDTDVERDAIREDIKLLDHFREAILAAGYPAESVPLISFNIESQQTVDTGLGWQLVLCEELINPFGQNLLKT